MTKKKADIGGKRLISLSPDKWVRWLTQNPNLTVQEIISADFQWVARESDVLLKVNSPQQGDFLILNELQLRYKQNVPQRINAYTALAIEKYNLPVYPVLINIFPNSKVEKIPHCYQSEFMGIKSYQDYKVINLWEIDAKIVFEQELTTLLPFVPILKGGGDEMVVRQAVQFLRNNEQLEELEPLLSFFASFVLSIPLVQQIMRWDMVVLRESPWYQEILKEGLERGEKQGIEQGIEQGLQQGLQQEGIKLVSKLIQRRFGEISSTLMLQLQQLSVEKLENLAEELLDITEIEQVQKWLQENLN
ncbi:MAG: Rpn family recombination-promoting nuclease/putative transposase [Gomphosphaeria aponina SAG 52.96 = DSM 107014]|uniref:Rpn family recombination-promoting nuclease/putative transposase n=1 Tax=Gomphosphaeria aponina SAG 52.96 = DSM 107014 TaxID=1521640 RepID=A0A941GV35_9CHRO|nr:Rpn family recombination-promoting nuclease/putative transposase [Gomphosphaeria aponina SAG 52.96 = DSM 107014]